MIDARVISDNLKNLTRLQSELRELAKKTLFAEAEAMTEHIKNEYLRGGTSIDKLAMRTGHLRRNTRALKVVELKGSLVSGTGFYNTKYAGVHIGPKGKKTVIRAKSKSWLTIPLKAAKTKAGVPLGRARSTVFGETFVKRSKKGNLIIFGKLSAQKGKNAGQAKGKIVPLFLLVKQVTIPTRVHPEKIIEWALPRMLEAFRKIGTNLGEKR